MEDCMIDPPYEWDWDWDPDADPWGGYSPDEISLFLETAPPELAI